MAGLWVALELPLKYPDMLCFAIRTRGLVTEHS